MTNAFNLLDNMDGLAATLAAIAFGFFAIDAVTVHPDDAHLAFALAGVCACGGFLPFNLRPHGKALVFMGDSGAQVLGFALAALGLAASWNVAGSTVATLLLPILILAVPVLDTTLVTTIRLLEGRPISQGGRDHSSHRLVRFGMSEKHAVLLLALIATALGGTSLAYNVLDDQRLAIVGVLVTFVLLVQFASFLADVERRSAPGADVRLADAFAVHWRRLIEVRRGFRPDRRLVRGGLPRPLRVAGNGVAAAPGNDRAAGAGRDALSRVHPVRPVPLDLAVRRLARPGRDRRRGRRLRGGVAGLRGRNPLRSATSRARSSSSTRSSARPRSPSRASPSAR